jgi:uncharacterized membrane protein YjdF
MNDFDKRKLVLDQLKWLAVIQELHSLSRFYFLFQLISLLQYLFFYCLVCVGGSYFFRKINMHFKDKPMTTNLKGIREFFKLVSHNPLSQSHDGYRRVKYFCMKCGNEHNKISCPKCGSKMKRIW